jgi:hypothetical protein
LLPAQVQPHTSPTAGGVRTVVEEEEHGADNGDEVERERDEVPDEAVEADALERADKRGAHILAAAAEPPAAGLDELGLAVRAERAVEDLGERGAEEELARAEREEHDALREHGERGDDRRERARDEDEDGDLREVGEEGDAGEDGGGERGAAQERAADGEEDRRVWRRR